MRIHLSLAGPALVLALAAATAPGAQGASPSPSPSLSPRQACRPSANSLCHDEVQAKNRAGVRACLIKNFDKVTPDCQAAMKAAKARGETPADSAPPDSAPPPKP